MRQVLPALMILGVMLITHMGCAAHQTADAVNAPYDAELEGSKSHLWPNDIMAGTWEGLAWRINSRGASQILDRLTITCEPHGLLKVKRSWKTVEGPGGHKGLTPVMSDEEELVGVFDDATGHFRLVEMDEPGTMDGYLVDRDTIEFFSTQPGRQPSTSHERLKRKSAP